MHLPLWSEFKIKAAHAYLGPSIGLHAAELAWNKPIEKYWKRVCLIANNWFSTYFSILAYNTYAVSCLEYLCQMYWIPPRLLKLEARAVAKILKSLSTPMASMAPFQLKVFDMLSIRSVLAINLAAMFRASRVTLWKPENVANRS